MAPSTSSAKCQAPSTPGSTSSSSDCTRRGLMACAKSLVSRGRHRPRRQGTGKRSSDCNTRSSFSSSCIEEGGAPLDVILPDDSNPNFFQCLIESRSWDRLRRHMRTERGLRQLQDEPLILHNAIKYHAPLKLVTAILNLKESCLYETDAAQRNLLHIAAMSWSSPETIEYLLQQRSRTIATEIDCDGRTPLHLLFASADDIRSLDNDSSNNLNTSSLPLGSILHYRRISEQKSPSQIAIQLLVKAAPENLNLEDADHMSPIEYAILSDDFIQLKMIQRMRRWSEEQWKSTQSTTTMAKACDDCDLSSSGTCSSFSLKIPLGSRRRRGGGLVKGEGGQRDHHRPLRRRLSRNANTA
jgi:hypothetical protein